MTFWKTILSLQNKSTLLSLWYILFNVFLFIIRLLIIFVYNKMSQNNFQINELNNV